MKRKNNELYDNAIRFCFQNENPSVWAFENAFNLSYEKAVELRVRLMEEGYVTLSNKKRNKNTNVSGVVKTNDCYITLVSI